MICRINSVESESVAHWSRSTVPAARICAAITITLESELKNRVTRSSAAAWRKCVRCKKVAPGRGGGRKGRRGGGARTQPQKWYTFDLDARWELRENESGVAIWSTFLARVKHLPQPELMSSGTGRKQPAGQASLAVRYRRPVPRH